MSSTEAVWRQFRQTRTLKLRNQIAVDNDKLAYGVANRWAGQCPEPVEDLAQIGKIGLIKAVERYDPDQGAAFSSFAIPYIHGEIQHHLRAHWGSIKIPQRAFEEAGKVKAVQRKMAVAGRDVTPEQAAKAVGISAKRWAWISEAVQRKQLATLDEVAEIADEADDNSREVLHDSLFKAVAKLPAIERRCLTAKYFRALADDVIAKQEGRTVEQIQVVISAAINRLKADLGDIYAEQF